MWSFLTGVALSVAISGFTLWAMMAGTVTMVERYDTISTLTGSGLWYESGSGTSMQAPVEGGI